MPTNAAYHLGATSKPMPMVYVDPERAVTDEQLAAVAEGTGLNGAFIADVLSDALMHERCGFHLYRSVAGRTNNPILKRRYQELGDETLTHVTVLEELIAAVGGDPGYVSPAARGTEKLDMGALEGSFMLSGSVDLMTQELMMLNAVVLAEAIDHANWETMAALGAACPDGPVKDAMVRAVEQVLPQEEEHVTWARDMRQRMILLQAQSKAMTRVGATMETMVARISSMFDDAPVPG
ncbi:MAG TPA: ferritin-like domain-containing protein [Acidimicrobiales bacterium]|nr:ferritin-like domain-containing protein [Acidimicrobiales bacterium]